MRPICKTEGDRLGVLVNEPMISSNSRSDASLFSLLLGDIVSQSCQVGGVQVSCIHSRVLSPRGRDTSAYNDRHLEID